MIPTNSSASTNGCNNISSNCVIWQGPDISCIDLCNGDSISEVTAKLATKVCDIITNGVDANPNLAGLDLTCLNIQGQTPTSLVPVLQAMVTQICANTGTGQVPQPNSRSSSQSQVESNLPIMTLPACLQYDDSNGNPVTELRLDEFASLIANQVCSNLQSIQLINTTLTSYDTRISTLEACVLPCSGVVAEKQVIPTCIVNVGQLTDVSVLLLALEQRFCALETAVGNPSAINSAIAQTSISGATSSLSTPTTSYGSITGWNNAPSTLSQSVQNAWVVIDDMYNAISAIQLNCCPSGCDSVSFAYTTSNILDSSGFISSVTFDFSASVIPSSFYSMVNRSLITITDADGLSVTSVYDVAGNLGSAPTHTVAIPTLNAFGDLSTQVQFGVTDGTSSCEDTIGTTIPGEIPCPSVIMLNTTTTGTTVQFSNNFGTTAVFTITIKEVSSGITINTYTVNNPGTTVQQAVTGLIAGTSYSAEVSIAIEGQTKDCPAVLFDTTSADAPCSDGMDVAFVIDYTSSMSPVISAVKSGVANLVNTIDTSSGANDYRLALVTADEYNQTTPAYNACADYSGLPSAQRVIATSPSGTYQYITSWEQFGTNNGTTFTSQLNKLDGGVDGTCVNLGQGMGFPEPTDYAAQLVTGASALCGTFRANVAKYVIIITDHLPGGQYDGFVQPVWSGIQQMIADANTNGIKYFVCGAGAGLSGNINGTDIFPWKELATQTGGGWNTSSDPSVISSEIVAGCS
jgi:hypothetical protein